MQSELKSKSFHNVDKIHSSLHLHASNFSVTEAAQQYGNTLWRTCNKEWAVLGNVLRVIYPGCLTTIESVLCLAKGHFGR